MGLCDLLKSRLPEPCSRMLSGGRSSALCRELPPYPQLCPSAGYVFPRLALCTLNTEPGFCFLRFPSVLRVVLLRMSGARPLHRRLPGRVPVPERYLPCLETSPLCSRLGVAAASPYSETHGMVSVLNWSRTQGQHCSEMQLGCGLLSPQRQSCVTLYCSPELTFLVQKARFCSPVPKTKKLPVCCYHCQHPPQSGYKLK